jgi:hypothetical protein
MMRMRMDAGFLYMLIRNFTGLDIKQSRWMTEDLAMSFFGL